MIISKDFIEYLKNFSSITTQMMFVEGKTQSIISPEKGIFASFTTDVEIDKQFGIYDISKFLNVLNLFTDPQLQVNDKNVKIFSDVDKKEVIYQISEYIVYETNTAKYSAMQEVVEFDLNFTDLSELNKIAHILDSKNIMFEGTGKDIFLKVINENDNAGSGMVKIGKSDKLFKAIVDREKMKLMNRNYRVGLSEKKAIHFSSDMLDYYMSLDRRSEI